MPFLRDHIIRSWIQVAAGTEVLVIADHLNVMIVENEDGERFSVKAELLSNAQPTEIPEMAAAGRAVNGKKRKSKSIAAPPVPLFI